MMALANLYSFLAAMYGWPVGFQMESQLSGVRNRDRPEAE